MGWQTEWICWRQKAHWYEQCNLAEMGSAVRSASSAINQPGLCLYLTLIWTPNLLYANWWFTGPQLQLIYMHDNFSCPYYKSDYYTQWQLLDRYLKIHSGPSIFPYDWLTDSWFIYVCPSGLSYKVYFTLNSGCNTKTAWSFNYANWIKCQAALHTVWGWRNARVMHFKWVWVLSE